MSRIETRLSRPFQFAGGIVGIDFSRGGVIRRGQIKVIVRRVPAQAVQGAFRDLRQCAGECAVAMDEMDAPGFPSGQFGVVADGGIEKRCISLAGSASFD